MNVLTIDIGGTNVKILATGQKECRKFPSGKTLTPQECKEFSRPDLDQSLLSLLFAVIGFCWQQILPTSPHRPRICGFLRPSFRTPSRCHSTSSGTFFRPTPACRPSPTALSLDRVCARAARS